MSNDTHHVPCALKLNFQLQDQPMIEMKLDYYQITVYTNCSNQLRVTELTEVHVVQHIVVTQ